VTELNELTVQLAKETSKPLQTGFSGFFNSFSKPTAA
jgi:hypothetical protein